MNYDTLQLTTHTVILYMAAYQALVIIMSAVAEGGYIMSKRTSESTNTNAVVCMHECYNMS